VTILRWPLLIILVAIAIYSSSFYNSSRLGGVAPFNHAVDQPNRGGKTVLISSSLNSSPQASKSKHHQELVEIADYKMLTHDYQGVWERQLSIGRDRGDTTLVNLAQARLVASAVYQMFRPSGFKKGEWQLEYDRQIEVARSINAAKKSGRRKLASLETEFPPTPPASRSDPLIEQGYMVLDEISERLTDIGLLDSSMEHLHQMNLKTIDGVIKDAVNYPDLYKLPVKGKIKVTDIDFEILSREIIRESNLRFALVGGSASALIGSTIHNRIKSALLSIVVHGAAALTFDTLFMALGIHYGIKRLYLLHAYYTYCRNQVDLLGNHVQVDELNQGFKLDSVAISDLLQREMQKLWVFGHITSLVIRKGKQGELISSIRQDLGQHILLWLGSPRLFSLIKGVTKLAFNFVSGRTITAFFSKHLFRGEMFAALKSSMPLMHRLVKKIFYLGKISAVGYLLDAGVSGAIMYAIMYVRLHASSRMLHGVYRSPAVNIYLAAMEKYRDIESFFKASAHIFLPLCLKLGEGQEDRAYRYSCHQISRYFKRGAISPAKIKGDQKSMEVEDYTGLAYRYPNHYRVLWSAALSAVYQEKQYSDIQEKLQVVKNQILIGRDKPRWYFEHITLDPYNMTIRMNAQRFTRLIAKGAELKKISQTAFFTRYWHTHLRQAKKQIVELEEIYQDSFSNSLAVIWEGVIGMKNSLRFSLKESFAKVNIFSTAHHNQIEVEQIP
jgi:hypothetical protein